MPQLLTKVTLDEVSLVDKGAAQGSRVVLMKRDTEEVVSKAPAGIQFVIGFPKEGGGSEVQSVVFDSKKWDAETAKTWLKEHDMAHGKVDETENSLRFRQQDPELFERFRTITPGAGVSKALKAKASFTQLQQAVSNALRDRYEPKPTIPNNYVSSYVYIRDLYKDSVIFEQDGLIYRCDYSVEDSDGELQVTIGDKVQVEIVYQDVKKEDGVPEVFPEALINRINNLRADVLKMNSCHNKANGKFCSGGVEMGLGGGGDFKDSVSALVRRKDRAGVKSKLNQANSEQIQQIADSLVRQGHHKSSNPEIKHLWQTVQHEAKLRGAKRDKDGYYNF